jgi:hypothetical protein
MGSASNILLFGKSYWFPNQNVLILCCVVTFGLVSVLGNPFLYDKGNSGRYLLGVIQAADPELFQNDQTVETLKRFRSGFYDVLAIGFEWSGAPPVHLKTTIEALYILSKFGLALALFGLAQTLSKDLGVFILFASWAAHQTGSPVGGETLFLPTLQHSNIVLILGLFALWMYFQKKYLVFWILISISILIHSLMAFHFILCVVPLLLYLNRNRWKSHAFGLLLVVISTLYYFAFMAPSALSLEEARIFLEAKGTISHISLLGQEGIEWIKMIGLVSLALVSYRRFASKNRFLRILAGFMISGVLAGFSLSLIPTFFPSPDLHKLALFQPVRIFVWVTLFSYLIILTSAVESLKTSRYSHLILILTILFTMLNSLWSLWMIYIGIFITVISGYSAFIKKKIGVEVETIARATLLVSIGGIFLMFLLGERQPFESFRNPNTIIPGIILLTFILIPRWQKQAYPFVIGFLIIYGIVAGSIYRYQYYNERTDPAWDVVRTWVSQNTAKTDLFLIAGGDGNFRPISFRSSAGEMESALAWVAPLIYLENQEAGELVRVGKMADGWDLMYLLSLAQQWNCQYLVLEGQYFPDNSTPSFQTGQYTVIPKP